MAASQQFPGIYWTLNDSGNEPFVFAFDDQGRSRGTFRVEGANNVDWEALQLGLGRDGGFALYVGDTGDNDGVRRDSTIYRVPEPRPDPPQNGSNRPRPKPTTQAEAFTYMFPGGSRDTEAFIVHPKTGEIVIITKEWSGRSRVYRLPTPLDSRRRATLEPIGTLDLTFLGQRNHEMVTDASITADAHRIAVRTYTRILEFDLADGESLDAVWSRTPRVYRVDDGPQGEGLSYRADGTALMSIGEDVPAVLFQMPWLC